MLDAIIVSLITLAISLAIMLGPFVFYEKRYNKLVVADIKADIYVEPEEGKINYRRQYVLNEFYALVMFILFMAIFLLMQTDLFIYLFNMNQCEIVDATVVRIERKNNHTKFADIYTIVNSEKFGEGKLMFSDFRDAKKDTIKLGVTKNGKYVRLAPIWPHSLVLSGYLWCVGLSFFAGIAGTIKFRTLYQKERTVLLAKKLARQNIEEPPSSDFE